jgi:hypothetical protein
VSTRLQRKWLEIGIDRYPVERPDLLERLKVFGDVRRPSRFHLGHDVLPIVDVTPFTEQIPPLLARSFVAAVAAQFSTVALQNTSAVFGGRRLNARPLVVKISANNGQISIALVPTPFAAIVQSVATFADSRRGTTGAVLGTDRGCIFGGVATAAVLPNQFVLTVPAGPDLFLPDSLLKLIFVAPGVDLVIQQVGANQNLDVSIAWDEEPVAGVTRVLG